MTPNERLIWKHLRLRQIDGFKFRRHQPIGEYIVDFVCLEKRLVIEIDGGPHSHQKKLGMKKRDEMAESPRLFPFEILE